MVVFIFVIIKDVLFDILVEKDNIAFNTKNMNKIEFTK